MSRFVLIAGLVAAVAVAACSPGATASNPPDVAAPPTEVPRPSASPSTAPPPATDAPTPAVPTLTPVAPRPPATPAPTAPSGPATPSFTADEQYLIDGLLRGVVGCVPVRAELPATAIAGIECTADSPDVVRVGFYLFQSDRQMLKHYVARMAAEGVSIESGNCRDGEHESAYIPGAGDDLNPYRHGCFIDDEGRAHFRATLPGSHVYIGVVGRVENMYAVERFAWLGNEDTPGGPSLWAPPIG